MAHQGPHAGRAGSGQGAGPDRRPAGRGGRGRAHRGSCQEGQGESVSAIAKALGVSRATLYRHLGENA
ncbi:helix-turn-helix domain-containing protein [Streptomyces roseicoloratus]|uniref:helix-turn-helix domain-containing protein n=1 Tax=Streptomyces roseicoloratus TaxID=2508722 RepID=UPI0035A73BDF